MKKLNPKTTLSYSRYSKYLRCRKAYDYQYIQELRPRGITDRALRLGTIVHAGLEYALKGEDIAKGIDKAQDDFTEEIDLTAEETEELSDLSSLAEQIVDRGIRFLDLDQWEVVKHPATGEPLVEAHLVMEAPKELQPTWTHIQGYADAVLRDKVTGCVFIFDHKCRKSFKSGESEEVATQFVFYQQLLAAMGLDFSGLLTFQLLNTVPKYPKLTKKGMLSKQKIATDWATYLEAIEAIGHSPNDYLDVKAWAAEKEFFRLTKNFRSAIELQRVWEEVLLVAQEMGEARLYRHLSQMGCSFCDFRALCLGELRDEDTEWIKRSQYRHRSEKNTRINPTDIELLEE